jgi:hypothetical protein
MGFEGLGNLMRSRWLSQETQKPVSFLLKLVCDAAHFRENLVDLIYGQNLVPIRL